MVHGGNHGSNGGTVGESQNADFGTGEELLNDDLVAGIAEGLILHDALDGFLALFQSLGDQNALAQSQTVGLDDDGEGSAFQIFHGLDGIIEDFVSSGGNAVLLHQVLGENLTCFNTGSLGIRAKAGNADFVQTVYAAQSQRIVGSNHSEINRVCLGKLHDCGNVLGADLGNADGVSGNAAVAGQSIDGLYRGIFFQLFDNGVLAATAANNEKVHKGPP